MEETEKKRDREKGGKRETEETEDKEEKTVKDRNRVSMTEEAIY